MSKSTTDNEYGFTPFANGRCQSLLQSTSMGSHPLLMVDVKVYWMGLHPLPMVDVKVYYSQQEDIATFAESICIV